MTARIGDLQFTFVNLQYGRGHHQCFLLDADPRGNDFDHWVASRVGTFGVLSMHPDDIELIKAKIRSGDVTVLYSWGNEEWWVAEDAPAHIEWTTRIHPFHANDDWKGIQYLEDSISVTYDTDGVPHLTVAADVRFINANAPYIPAPAPIPPAPPVPGTQAHWGVRRLMVHNITQRLEEAAVQFTNELQFYWSSQDAIRFWATERQLTSWIAMVREHLAILAAGNTTHTVSVEVGTPFDLGRPVHNIPILEALPWMMDQLEIMLSEGVLHYFDFHPDVLHAELGIFPSKPTYFLWGVDGAGLVSQRMVREIIVLDWAATRKFEYAAARRGDPVEYTLSYGEKLHAAALKYDAEQAGLTGSSVDNIRQWYESWLGYGSKLHQDDKVGDEISLVNATGNVTKAVAGEHVLEVLARQPDPQALHDAHSTDLAAKLTAHELWDMDASGVLTSRVDVAHASSEWAQLQKQYYEDATTNRE